ncbi:MAG: LuxR C-terminal-related transcriptional regulator [Paraprevotella sp.]|nr:LuxR C-terminal-related transcriptional regulator [Paraprevotella sp.]
MPHNIPEIAIVNSNTLTCIGLQTLIERMMKGTVVRTFNSFDTLMRDTPDAYVHYFISSGILLEHAAFFLQRKHKTIVLTTSQGMPHQTEFHTLDVNLPEEQLVRALLRLQQSAHSHGRHLPPHLTGSHPVREERCEPNGLTAREVEVLILIVRGMLNKEIADRLGISLTTVISHRKNLTEKLNIRSVSGLTIYAVMNGYIEADRI